MIRRGLVRSKADQVYRGTICLLNGWPTPIINACWNCAQGYDASSDGALTAPGPLASRLLNTSCSSRFEGIGTPLDQRWPRWRNTSS